MSRPSAEPSSNSTNPTPTEHDSSSSTTPKSPNTANSTSPTNSPPPSNTTLPNTDLVADDLLFGTPTMTPNPHTETATATTPTPAGHGTAGHGTAGHGTAGHGTATRYNTGCRCQHCRTAIATYRRHRRAHGHDRPTRHRRTRHDQHLDRSWFRRNIWYHALANAGLTHKDVEQDRSQH